MGGVVKTAVYVLVWEFTVLLVLMIFNTMVFGYMVPVFDGIAASESMIDNARYQANTVPIKVGLQIAFFIFAAIPFIYLFVRMLLRREQTAPPQYGYPPQYSYPPRDAGLRGRADNFGRSPNVRI